MFLKISFIRAMNEKDFFNLTNVLFLWRLF